MMYFLDFEFTSSAEHDVDVVCAVIIDESGMEKRYWLHRNKAEKIKFGKVMNLLKGQTLVAYAALAECRALRSLGIDPMQFEWIDLYVEWRQLRNHNNKFKFGWVKGSNGTILKSKPHHIHHDCHIETSASLASCALRLLKLDIDEKHKERMRNLILSKGESASIWSNEEKENVLNYCAEDVRILPSILKKFKDFYQKYFKEDRVSTWKNRGRYIAALSKSEHIGIPIDIRMLHSIDKNRSMIAADACESMNATFPLFTKFINGKYVFKRAQFKEMLVKLGFIHQWPRTPSGLPSTRASTIEAFRSNVSIQKFHETRKILSSLRSIRGDRGSNLFERIGTDNCLRSFFGPFGTQTGRNAPKASHFVLAMSNWLRVIIRPPMGKCITAVDYSSQEFAIAASLSRDRNMIQAYQSGDPYLYFAKQAGAIPKDGSKETYGAERDLFKSTTLGLQYGMGVSHLSEKLSQDTGKPISEEEAKELIQLHQEIYPQFWNWTEALLSKYRIEGALETTDGWILFGDNPKPLSVKNFLIQATGASIMRQAVIFATEAGLDVISPLHDALYIVRDENDSDSVEVLKSCMNRAAEKFVDLKIRVEMEHFRWDQPWVEPKGLSDFLRFKKYLVLS